MPPGYINQNPYSQQNRSVSSLTQDRTGAPVQHLPYPVNNDDPGYQLQPLAIQSHHPPQQQQQQQQQPHSRHVDNFVRPLRATCPNSN